MKTILILLIIFVIGILVLRKLKIKENLELPSELDIMSSVQIETDPHFGVGSGWNSALVPVYNGTYVLGFNQKDDSNFKQMSLDINLAKDKNEGTVTITETNTSSRKDVSNPDLQVSCNSLSDLVQPYPQKFGNPLNSNSNITLKSLICQNKQNNNQCPSTNPHVYAGAGIDGGYCCSVPPNSSGYRGSELDNCNGTAVKCSKPPCVSNTNPNFINAKTSCTTGDKDTWNKRLQDSLKGVGYYSKLCGQWCVPDIYDNRVNYSWNPGNKNFDINGSECNQWKKDVKSSFNKIQQQIGVDINQRVTKTLFTMIFNVSMTTPNTLIGINKKN